MIVFLHILALSDLALAAQQFIAITPETKRSYTLTKLTLNLWTNVCETLFQNLSTKQIH